jgi:hypothetical protein
VPDPYRPAALAVVKAVRELTTQVGRIADALATPVDDHAVEEATTPDDADALRTARRDSVLVLLSCASRGVLTPDEGALLRQHVEAEMRDADTARTVAAGNKRHVQVMYAELEQAQAAIERVREALASLHRTMAHDPRDWALDERDAWLWGIVCGWECEEQHDHDVICGRDNALRQVAARHRWPNEAIDRLKTYRRAVAALDEPKEARP